MRVILTCEHAVPDIPRQHRNLFENETGVLSTHEGYDPGAWDLFKTLQNLADFSNAQVVGRLLVETNRSLRNRKLFSRFSSALSKVEKESILKSYYYPYRQKIEDEIQKYIISGHKVLHLSVHSFTPVLNDKKRNCDLGLLYDPNREEERLFCRDLKAQLRLINPGLIVRFNYPYLGKADGFTTSLRKLFPSNYLGIEIEVNQAWVNNNVMNVQLKEVIHESLKELIKKKAS